MMVLVRGDQGGGAGAGGHGISSANILYTLLDPPPPH